MAKRKPNPKAFDLRPTVDQVCEEAAEEIVGQPLYIVFDGKYVWRGDRYSLYSDARTDRNREALRVTQIILSHVKRLRLERGGK